MKRELILALCAGAALLALRASAQDPPPDDQETRELEKRVDDLGKALAVTIETVDALTVELAETSGLLAQTVGYLQAQAQSAEEMSKTLDLSEAEGFTFGINPRSREVLLEGWREGLKQAQLGVPGARPAEQAGEGEAPVEEPKRPPR